VVRRTVRVQTKINGSLGTVVVTRERSGYRVDELYGR
jgi:hypothetical protein